MTEFETQLIGELSAMAGEINRLTDIILAVNHTFFANYAYDLRRDVIKKREVWQEAIEIGTPDEAKAARIKYAEAVAEREQEIRTLVVAWPYAEDLRDCLVEVEEMEDV